VVKDKYYGISEINISVMPVEHKASVVLELVRGVAENGSLRLDRTSEKGGVIKYSDWRKKRCASPPGGKRSAKVGEKNNKNAIGRGRLRALPTEEKSGAFRNKRHKG